MNKLANTAKWQKRRKDLLFNILKDAAGDGMSYKDIGKIVGEHPTSIYEYITGKRNYSNDKIENLLSKIGL